MVPQIKVFLCLNILKFFLCLSRYPALFVNSVNGKREIIKFNNERRRRRRHHLGIG